MADAMRGDVGTWRFKALGVGAEPVLRVQGYRDLERVRPAIRRAAEETARAASDLAAPEARVARVPIAHCSDSELELVGGFSFSCPVFGRVLTRCSEAVVFVLTLGPRLEAEVAERYGKGQPLESYLMDAAGWLLVERASRELRGSVAQQLAGESLALTARLGPGYDYRDGGMRSMWPLDQQKELFRIFGEADLPVSLLDSCAMLPRMSRSGMYGALARRQPAHSQSKT